MRLIHLLIINLIILPCNFLYAECRFGLLIPLTGDFASAGQECLDGHQVAVDHNLTKNLPIEFKIEDSRGQGKEGVTAFRKLAEIDKVSAVSVVRAAVGMPINPISKQLQIPIIGPVSHPNFTSQNPNAYQIWPSTADETLTLAKLMIADGIKSIYSLASEDEWYLSFQTELNKNYTSLGGKLISSNNIDANFQDFRSLISKIQQSQAETVFLGLPPSQLVSFIKQFRERGLKQKVYTTFWVKSEDVTKGLSPKLLDQIAFVEIDSAKLKFLENLQKINNKRQPSAMSYTCYVTSEALYQACEMHINKRDNFQSIFSQMNSVQTLDLSVAIKQRIADLDVVAREFKDGKIQAVVF